MNVYIENGLSRVVFRCKVAIIFITRYTAVFFFSNGVACDGCTHRAKQLWTEYERITVAAAAYKLLAERMK